MKENLKRIIFFNYIVHFNYEISYEYFIKYDVSTYNNVIFKTIQCYIMYLGNTYTVILIL